MVSRLPHPPGGQARKASAAPPRPGTFPRFQGFGPHRTFGGEVGVLDWSEVVSSGGVPSSQPRKILHSFQYTQPPPLPGHTLHALSVTVAKSRAHDHDSRRPARRPNRRPYGAPLGPAQQRSPPGPDSLLRTGQTSVRASSPCQKWASPHSARAPGQLSPNRDAGFLKSGD